MLRFRSSLLCVASLIGCTSGRDTQSPDLKDVIQAVDRVGLIHQTAFVDTTYTDRESPQFRRQLDSGFLAFPTGAADVILHTDRFLLAVDSATSFAVTAYSPAGRLSLVQVFAPLVNGSEEQGRQVLATMNSVAAVLAGDTMGLQAWIDTSSRAVWRDWEHARTRKDIVREKRFGNYLMGVSGVPPDFINFGAVRVE